jgi:opacity protein-like surface antigen
VFSAAAAAAAACSAATAAAAAAITRYCPDPKDTAACGESTLKYKVLTAGFRAWNDKREVLLKAALKVAAAGSKLNVSQASA